MSSFESKFYNSGIVEENLFILQTISKEGKQWGEKSIQSLFETRTGADEVNRLNDYEFDIEVKVVSVGHDVHLLEVGYVRNYEGDQRELIARMRERMRHTDWSIISLSQLLNQRRGE